MACRHLCGAIVGLFLLAPAAAAFQGGMDEAWQNLIREGTYLATDTHDNAKAEAIFQKALHEAERFGADDVRVAATENRLGMVYRDEKKYADSEGAFRRALPIFEKVYGADSIDVANTNFNLATALVGQGKSAAALPYLQQCRLVFEKGLGNDSLKAASVNCMIGDAYRLQKFWHEAEGPLKSCAHARELANGVLDPDFGEAENSLALVLQAEGKYAIADSAFKMAEKIRERVYGITSPALADTLEAHAELLKGLGRTMEAERDQKMAAAIRKIQARAK